MALVSATVHAGYSGDRKQPTSIVYVLDANAAQAYWASYNTKVSAFEHQFLGDTPTKGSYDTNTTASKYKSNIKFKW